MASIVLDSANGIRVDAEKPADTRLSFERKMGHSETSYFLPSRASGVNDMYLHLGMDAPERLVEYKRVKTVWAIMRGRHPLFACRVEMHDYDDIRFVYTPPLTIAEVFEDAEKSLDFRAQTGEEMTDSYLNGPRILSNKKLSCLVVAQPWRRGQTPDISSSPESRDTIRDVRFMLSTTHYVGDGVSLHTWANHFFGLLGSQKTQKELDDILQNEWNLRWTKLRNDPASALPENMEKNFIPVQGRFRKAATQIDFQLSQNKLVGGQVFPRRKDPVRKTVVPYSIYDPERTKKMIKTCKAHGVSISAALFAICNFAWAGITTQDRSLPMMMYSAVNVRPYLNKPPVHDSYCYLSIGYFNVILPSFLPPPENRDKVFWHRARIAKDQSASVGKNPMLVSRTLEMARKRGDQARAWGKEDDEREKGTFVPPPPVKKPEGPPPAPSAALFGLSMLGNLDAIYQHATWPEIKMHTLTSGSRQRNGAMLMFGYTFAGRMWVLTGYDENGYEKPWVQNFLDNVSRGIDEFLLQ